MLKMLTVFVGATILLAVLNRWSVRGKGVSRCWGDGAAVVVTGVGYLLLLAVTGRFLTASLIGIGLILLLAAGNHLKQVLLGEPLVFSDVFLAGHALRFPRLYFGYVPLWVWLVLIAVVGIVGGLAAQEAPISGNGRWLCAALLTVALLLVTALGFALWQRREALLSKYGLTFKVNRDAERYTPLGAAVLQTLWHLAYGEKVAEDVAYFEEKTHQPSSNAGHFVLIQAESYCDLRSQLGRVPVTPVLDALAREGASGPLELDWRGAYTMRTEFSVLTGCSTTSVKSWAPDPYRLAERVPMDSLARDFKAAGYDTVAWHPNDGRFFNRNTVMPHFGFDRFVSGDAFADLPKSGSGASDEALLAKAADFLATCRKPTFLFIVTMEAHGPWGGRTEAEELSRYERHLMSLDRGVNLLAERLRRMPGAHLALYGDHLPGLKALRTPQTTSTRWVMWPAVKAASGPRRAAQLRKLIQREGLE